MNFADYLSQSIQQRESILCAGMDLRPEHIPHCFIDSSLKGEAKIEKIITDYYLSSLEALEPHVACIKPNIAFFERYGFGALRALASLCEKAKELSLPVILDAKRGDIGSTNQAYADAYLHSQNFLDEHVATIHADAITVNPFLGLDSVRPFLDSAKKSGKGIFLLVRTSNPDASYLQDSTNADGITISDTVANWSAEEADVLAGTNGLSALGAVVGATHPDQAKKLRELMPNNIFLVPGYGSQGGSAKGALAGARAGNGLGELGVIINSSRGIFGIENAENMSAEDFQQQVSEKSMGAKQDLVAASKE